MIVSEILYLLLAYQDIDMQIQKIQERRLEYDEEKKFAQEKLLSKKNTKIEIVKQKRSLEHQKQENEYEITKIQDRIRQLNLELYKKGRTNKEYKILLGKIESLKNQKIEMEDQLLKIMEQEEKFKKEADNKELDLLEAEIQYDQTVKEIEEKQRGLDAQTIALKQSLVETEKELEREGMKFLSCYKKLRKRLSQPIVEIKDGTCGGCNIKVPTSLLCDSLKFEEMVTCSTCGRIVFSTMGIISHVISSEEIENANLRLPPLIQLYCKDGDTVKLFDFWNAPWNVKIEAGYIIGVRDIFNKYKLSEGDHIFIQEISREERKYRISPELISGEELNSIIAILERSEEAVDLSNVIHLVLKRKADIFGYLLIKGELRRMLLNDPRFDIFGDKIITKKRIPVRIIEISGKEEPVTPLPTTGTETRFKLTEEAIRHGFFEVGSDLRYLFETFNDHSRVELIAYFNYPISVIFVKDSMCLEGGGLAEWYGQVGLNAGDTVFLEILNKQEKIFRIYTKWGKDIDDIILKMKIMNKSETESYLCEKELSFCDLIYITLKQCGTYLHFHDIWDRVCKYRITSVKTICGILSQYNRRLFIDVGGGKWGLAEWKVVKDEKVIIDKEVKPSPEVVSTDDDLIWKAILEIEENDLVFKTLQHEGQPMFYEEISKKLAGLLGVNVEQLMKTAFLNTKDERLQRLDNGAWALKEWVVPRPPIVIIVPRRAIIVWFKKRLKMILTFLGKILSLITGRK